MKRYNFKTHRVEEVQPSRPVVRRVQPVRAVRVQPQPVQQIPQQPPRRHWTYWYFDDPYFEQALLGW